MKTVTNESRRFPLRSLGLFGALSALIVMTVLSVLFVAGFNGGEAQSMPLAPAEAPTLLKSKVESIQTTSDPVDGLYDGTVDLKYVVSGVFSDTLTPPTPEPGNANALPNLGEIILGLHLEQSGSSVSGYVLLDDILVFPGLHTVDLNQVMTQTLVGPRVDGTFDGSKLLLASETFTGTVSNQTVRRQFQIDASAAQEGIVLSGEYRETIWGFGVRPITAVGPVSLKRPNYGSILVDQPNDAPQAAADTATTTSGQSITIDVLGNDSDANGDVLTITAVDTPSNGAASTDGRNILYRANDNFVGTDSFGYTVSDGRGGQANGTVTVTVVAPGSQQMLYMPNIRKD